MILANCAGSNCAGWEPIRPSHKDFLTDGTAAQILKHDTFGQSQHCAAFTTKGKYF